MLAAATGALASTWNGTYTTVIVTALTTYCPFATELTHNGIVYTVTEETTLTITDSASTFTNIIERQSTLRPQSSTPPAHQTLPPPQQTTLLQHLPQPLLLHQP